MKKVTALILSLLILLITAVSIIASDSDITRNETDDRFTDVYSDDWFYKDLKTVCDTGLLQGKGNGIFDPDAYVTTAEISVVAARLHAYYSNTEVDFTKTSPWYVAYSDYCDYHGVFVPERAPEDYITREEFWEVVDKYVNKDLFEKVDGKWKPKFTVGEDYES